MKKQYHMTLDKNKNNIIIEKITDSKVPASCLIDKQDVKNSLKYYPKMTTTFINCFPHNFK